MIAAVTSAIETAVIYKVNTERTASVLAKWLLSNFPGIDSVFDIGCGDGIVSAHLPAPIRYAGLDIGADIYPRTSLTGIAYVEDLELLEERARQSARADAVLLLDVLEHTPSFTSLFEIALEKADRFVLVSLPNEANLRHAIHLLRDRLPGAHGVGMLNHRPGHRHQWLINISQALQVLHEIASARGFQLKVLGHIANESPNPAKRIAFRAATFALPWRLRCDQFLLLFEKLGRNSGCAHEQLAMTATNPC